MSKVVPGWFGQTTTDFSSVIFSVPFMQTRVVAQIVIRIMSIRIREGLLDADAQQSTICLTRVADSRNFFPQCYVAATVVATLLQRSYEACLYRPETVRWLGTFSSMLTL